MTSIVIYNTRHGSTKKVAEKLARRLKNTDVHDLADNHAPDLTAYDQVILGTPIYAGMSNGTMKTYCIEHSKELLHKRLALFVLGIQPAGSKEREEEFRLAFPNDLQKHAVAYAFLGGELKVKSLSQAEKLVIAKFIPSNKDISMLDDDALEAFLSVLKKA